MTDVTAIIRNASAGDRRLGRRSVVGGTAGAVAVGLANQWGASAQVAAQEASPPAAEDRRETFVLVHGSWFGGWVWRKLVPLLREAGHDVHAPTLTGLGDRAHLARPSLDLDIHVTDVVNVLEFEDLHNVTLVGWSYGGWIITGWPSRCPSGWRN